MRYYFLSAVEGDLIYSGKFLGKINRNLKTTDETDDAAFFFSSDGFFPCVLGEKCTYNAIKRNFYDGALFIPNLVPLPENLKVFDEKRTTARGVSVLAKLISDGERKLMIEALGERLIVPVARGSYKSEIIPFGDHIVFDVKGIVTTLVIISLHTMKVVFSVRCVDYQLGETLAVVKTVSGLMRGIVTEHYKIGEIAELIGVSARFLGKTDGFSPLTLPVAFLETLKAGGDAEKYLSKNLKGDVKNLKEFFGDYEFIVPPVKKEFPFVYALVSKSAVKYASFTIEDGAICDVLLENLPKNAV